MDQGEKSALDKLFPIFLTSLEPKDILPDLVSKKIVTDDDNETIRNQAKYENRRQRVVGFMDVVQRKLTSLPILVPILERQGYRFLADQISGEISAPLKHLTETREQQLKWIRQFYLTFSYVRLIPQDSRSIMELEKVWVDPTIQRWKQRSAGDSGLTCLKMTSTNGLPVIIAGEAGSGKSTLVKWIPFSWAKSGSTDYDIILMAKLKEVERADNILDICIKWMTQNCAFLRQKEECKRLNETIQATDPARVLLLLDGLDECRTECPELQKMYDEEFYQSLYPLVITTRSYKTSEIQCNHHSCYISPLSLSQQMDFIKRYFMAQDMPQEAERFLQNIKQNESLQKATKTPMLLLLSLISGYFTDKFNETELYISLCTTLVSTYCKGHKDSPLTTSNWLKSDLVKRLGKLALEKQLHGQSVFSAEDLDAFQLPESMITIGFLKADHERRNFMREKLEVFYSFLHSTFQEFFAALMLYNSYHDSIESGAESDKENEFDLPTLGQLHRVRPLSVFGPTFFQVLGSTELEEPNEFQSFIIMMQQQGQYAKTRHEQTILFLVGLLSLNSETSGIRALLSPNQLDSFSTEQDDVSFFGKIQDQMRWDDHEARGGILESAKIRGHTLLTMDKDTLHRNFSRHLEEITEGIYRCNDFDGCPFILFDAEKAEEVSEIPKSEFSQVNTHLNQYRYFMYAGSEDGFQKFGSYFGIFMRMQHLKVELHGESSQELIKCDLPPFFLRKLWLSTVYSNTSQLVPDSFQEFLRQAEKLEDVTLVGPRDVSLTGLQHIPSTVKRLAISNTICHKEVGFLCQNLKLWPELEDLTLKTCLVDSKSAVRIINGLKRSRKLVGVDLSFNKCLSKNLSGLRKIFDAVSQLPQLEELRLIECEITDEGASVIMNVIPPHLKRCGLGFNKLTGEMMGILQDLSEKRGVQFVWDESPPIVYPNEGYELFTAASQEEDPDRPWVVFRPNEPPQVVTVGADDQSAVNLNNDRINEEPIREENSMTEQENSEAEEPPRVTFESRNITGNNAQENDDSCCKCCIVM